MTEPTSAAPPATSSPILILAAWLLVSIPAVWGISFTLKNAAKLFVAQPAAGRAGTGGNGHPRPAGFPIAGAAAPLPHT